MKFQKQIDPKIIIGDSLQNSSILYDDSGEGKIHVVQFDKQQKQLELFNVFIEYFYPVTSWTSENKTVYIPALDQKKNLIIRNANHEWGVISFDKINKSQIGKVNFIVGMSGRISLEDELFCTSECKDTNYLLHRKNGDWKIHLLPEGKIQEFKMGNQADFFLAIGANMFTSNFQHSLYYLNNDFKFNKLNLPNELTEKNKITGLCPLKNGNLLVSFQLNKVVKLMMYTQKKNWVDIEHTEKFSPTVLKNPIIEWKNNVYVGSKNGIFRLEKQKLIEECKFECVEFWPFKDELLVSGFKSGQYGYLILNSEKRNKWEKISIPKPEIVPGAHGKKIKVWDKIIPVKKIILSPVSTKPKVFKSLNVFWDEKFLPDLKNQSNNNEISQYLNLFEKALNTKLAPDLRNIINCIDLKENVPLIHNNPLESNELIDTIKNCKSKENLFEKLVKEDLNLMIPIHLSQIFMNSILLDDFGDGNYMLVHMDPVKKTTTPIFLDHDEVSIIPQTMATDLRSWFYYQYLNQEFFDNDKELIDESYYDPNLSKLINKKINLKINPHSWCNSKWASDKRFLFDSMNQKTESYVKRSFWLVYLLGSEYAKDLDQCIKFGLFDLKFHKKLKIEEELKNKTINKITCIPLYWLWSSYFLKDQKTLKKAIQFSENHDSRIVRDSVLYLKKLMK